MNIVHTRRGRGEGQIRLQLALHEEMAAVQPKKARDGPLIQGRVAYALPLEYWQNPDRIGGM